jgi:hypothetical protein
MPHTAIGKAGNKRDAWRSGRKKHLRFGKI